MGRDPKSIHKQLLISIGVTVFVLVAAMVGLVANRVAEQTVPSILPGLDSISFTLQSSDGPVSNDDLLGRPVAVFFGFTHCPEVCPTTLYTLTSLIDEIGADGSEAGDTQVGDNEAGDTQAANTQVVFITVDPERDTPAILADYIRSMSDQAIGLSGSRAAIDEAIKGFGVYSVKVPLDGDDGDYTMDHTATVFLYDQTGALSGTIAWGERADFAREKLKRLISG